jgi:hypothetical protein
MDTTLKAACKQCGEQMQVIAKVPPVVGASGLVVFLCVDCDRSDTMLVEAERWDAAVGQSDRRGG